MSYALCNFASNIHLDEVILVTHTKGVSRCIRDRYLQDTHGDVVVGRLRLYSKSWLVAVSREVQVWH